MNMEGFKLIGIRPLKNCDEQYLKNLQKGTFYKFYKDFHFLNSKDQDISTLNYTEESEENLFETSKIKYSSSIPTSLYSIHNHKIFNINISAIVGKNGSGKSTIIELFSLFIFSLSVKLQLINVENLKKEHGLSSFNKTRLDKEISKLNSFRCEIYYQIKDKIFCLTKGAYIFEIAEYNKLENEELYILNRKYSVNTQEKIDYLKNTFFYSILANYSLYGLNTNDSGIWLKSIFHKNDGYQTPIVLNPMRTDGNIDVNRLAYLSKARLLSNIFKKLEENQKEEDSLRNLTNNKIVRKLHLTLDIDKFDNVDPENISKAISILNVINFEGKSIHLGFSEKYLDSHFSLLMKSFIPDFNDSSIYIGSNTIRKLTVEYILRKAHAIISKYPEYKSFSKKVFRSNYIEDNVVEAFNKLAEDFSHSTLKLRQAINFFVYDLYDITTIKKTFDISTNEKSVGIVDFVNNKIEDLKSKDNSTKKLDEKYNIINFLPPSFFEVDIEFKNKGFFKDLSSGEKQMVYSLASIIYHLKNLKSISTVERITYKYFNIILDEVELCFHPQFQRDYIYELIRTINSLDLNFEGINILFLTHSPFILSDIPNSNILSLKDGYPTDINLSNTNTFGANIIDLLSNEFFLEEGVIGKFAQEKIQDVINYINYEDKRNEIKWITSKKVAKDFIEIIGEPYLREKIMDMFINTFEEFKDDEILILEERIKSLRSKKNRL